VLRIERLKVGSLPPLTFEVATGECLAVEGPSGSGKTRLLRAIADLDVAAGYVYLDGVERNEMSGSAWRKKVRFVAAEPAWWAETVRAHVPVEAHGRFERIASSLGLEPAVLDRPVSVLSTGERQRLAIARSLLDEPPVLLLDEPCASLDSAAAALVEELIRFQTLAGRTVILVSHVAGQVQRLAHARLQLAAIEDPESLGGEVP